MKDSLRTGISLGMTSAVITTLGLMVGLHSGTHSKIVVLAGIVRNGWPASFGTGGRNQSEYAPMPQKLHYHRLRGPFRFLLFLLFWRTTGVPIWSIFIKTQLDRTSAAHTPAERQGNFKGSPWPLPNQC